MLVLMESAIPSSAGVEGRVDIGGNSDLVIEKTTVPLCTTFSVVQNARIYLTTKSSVAFEFVNVLRDVLLLALKPYLHELSSTQRHNLLSAFL